MANSNSKSVGLKKRWASQTKKLSPHQIVLEYINKSDELSLSLQAELLGIGRSSLYYIPVAPNPEDFLIMNRMDEIYTDFPYYGYRKMTAQLRRDGYSVNHKRVSRLMNEMGIQAIFSQPHLSKNLLPHPTFPYLLKNLDIIRPNQVWGTDITYIKLSQGFLYLTAFMDWFSRYVVAWRLSTTLSADFVVTAANQALSIATPEIINSDQGVQFTSQDYINIWNQDETKISMDHRGRCFDNIFTERLWRTVKYNEVYLKNYDSVIDARDGLSQFFDKYNNRQLHQSLNYQTPAEVYFKN